ncbi:formate dehydrogenase accessory sulfurtransferase FdhD [Paraneptunicella aestuarii]|uniref:formate dehydrogenase accessory sulfurtransferase FdhD n=1 Tax=Paraneptunicella aestuarii TaxID=2831148 RepID=UPI001E50DF4D|nr:formate dehydrogenase accessory sulfurtransferase FdhD [Paraneptunicella aestuarii]UAA38571.1 formate dehydrogenase accessory sulfurtransferase FdhD [Paraneptunicella aestuarii]
MHSFLPLPMIVPKIANDSVSVSIQQLKQPSQQETWQQKSDWVAVEEPLEIWVKFAQSQDKPFPLTVTMRTPGDDLDLVKGWLLSTASISVNDIVDIRHTGTETLKSGQSNRVIVTLKDAVQDKIAQLARSEIISSSCGVCGFKQIENLMDELHQSQRKANCRINLNPISLDNDQIFALTHHLKENQPLFAATGGVHGVGLFDATGKLLDVREDVGRHNAMDKLIGAHYEKFSSSSYGVVLSGRVSFDMVQKAVKASIVMIVAIGAPSSLAIELAKEADISLYGFINSNKINRYV